MYREKREEKEKTRVRKGEKAVKVRRKEGDLREVQ